MNKTSAKSTVLVIGNNTAVQKMFNNNGFKVLYDNGAKGLDPDLVCFTGGEDVDPAFYKEPVLFRTRINPRRDVYEAGLFEKYLDKPKVGICRGGQFLNVVSGGAMWQNVNNHTDSHKAVDLLFTKQELWVTSTHHQMMIPGSDSYMLAMATIATEFLSANKKRENPEYDPEVLWYPKTNSLCFQPHPEYNSKQGKTEHTEYFFKLIDWAYDLPTQE